MPNGGSLQGMFNGERKGPVSSASQIITTNGVPLETALAGLAQSALTVDRLPASGIMPIVTQNAP